MKKICLIIHSLGIGGMERVMSLLATHFANKEHVQVDVLLIGKDRKVVYNMPKTINICRPSFQFNNDRRILNTIKTMRFIRRGVKAFNPDTILSFGEYWNNMVLLALYRLSYPIFISDRSIPGKHLGKFQNYLRDTLYPQATGYIAQTQKAKEVCIAKGWNDNICVIGNPIRKINTAGHTEKENIILSVGRLIKTKHFDQLIRIFAKIKNPDWKLLIVGGDAKNLNLSKDLALLIEELGVEDRVFLEGEQKDIDAYYKKSKIFAFTSSSEGFPNVIGEALSAGLPVVAYDCTAGPSDMIEDGTNGFLVPLFEEKMFKEKLSLLMENTSIRKQMSNKANKSLSKFDAAIIAEKFYTFLLSEAYKTTINR